MTVTYTKAELRQFDRLVEQASSRDQMDRINARLGQKAFIEKHGREKVDAMWAELQRREKKKA